MGVTDLSCLLLNIMSDPSFHSLDQRSYVYEQSNLFSAHGTSTVACLSSE